MRTCIYQCMHAYIYTYMQAYMYTYNYARFSRGCARVGEIEREGGEER